MYQESVILTGHSAFQVNTRYGQKTKNVFTDTQGREFQVWKQDLAATLLATMGQQVTLQFEAKQNGQYVNYDVKEILGGAGASPVAAPVAPAVNAPVAAQAAPAQVAQTPPPAQGINDSQRQLYIMRQKAAGDAIVAFGVAGIDPVENSKELLEFAQEVLLDFYQNGFSLEETQVDVGAVAAQGPVA